MGTMSRGSPPPEDQPPQAGDALPRANDAQKTSAARRPASQGPGATSSPTPAKERATEAVYADALQSRREALSHMDARLARPAPTYPEDTLAPLDRTDPERAIGPGAANAAPNAVPNAVPDDWGQDADASRPADGGDVAGPHVDARDPEGTDPRYRPQPEIASDPQTLVSTPAANDPALNRYIASLNLTDLDLSDVELPPAQAASVATLLGCAGVNLVGLVAMLWLPSTALYQLHATGEVLFWACAAGVAGATWVGARHRDAARQLVQMASARTGPHGPQLPVPHVRVPRWLRQLARHGRLQQRLLAWRRPLLAGGIVTLAACVAFVLPREPEWAGNTYSAAWFFAVMAAMSCGVLVGRFILAQAAASPLTRELKPFTPPTWFRWVSLGLLFAAGLVTSFGAQWFNLSGGGVGGEFPLAGLGLATGIGGAIWMARRFDELEAKWRQETAAKTPKSEFDDLA